MAHWNEQSAGHRSIGVGRTTSPIDVHVGSESLNGPQQRVAIPGSSRLAIERERAFHVSSNAEIATEECRSRSRHNQWRRTLHQCVLALIAVTGSDRQSGNIGC